MTPEQSEGNCITTPAISRRTFCAAPLGAAITLAVGDALAATATDDGPGTSAAASTRLHPTYTYPSLTHHLRDARKTAVLVVDMQHAYVDDAPFAQGVIPKIAELLQAARRAGGGVAWTRHCFVDAPGLVYPGWMIDTLGPERYAKTRANTPGSRAHAICDGLAAEVRPDDIIIDKHRFSAFLPQTTGLHAELQHKGYDTLIVTGTLTNYCCESSARDALMLDYRVLMVPDATAAMNDEAQHATFAHLSRLGLIDLRPSAALIEELRAS